jgi:Tol biopolymer transport system component
LSLPAGSRLGSYEIVGALGAGGMGEVYRARDTRLHRDVAIKILPPLFASDPERLARFEREAQTLASLNHPNVAHVYGLEGQALVMELVEGQDLAQRISRGAVPVDETIEIALQIARGVEAAHERGVVHRDLKPANVKVAPDGVVKVLDFGLAKALDPAGSGSLEPVSDATVTSPVTQMGVILGTAAYMAPEQARGKLVDKRADIWAFGCVVFEMLTGQRPFGGETVTDMLAAIVKEEPDLKALPLATPPALKRLISYCLVKDPKQRLRDIGDARLALERIASGTADDGTPAAAAAQTARARGFGLAHLVTAALATASIAGLAIWLWMRPAPASPPAVARFVTGLPTDVMPLRTNGAGVAFSPDGKEVVYAAQPALLTVPMLVKRRLESLEVERLPNTEGAYAPFFSPDGKWIGFFTDTAVMKLAVDGGSVSKICNRGRFSRATWAPDGTIVLGTSVPFAPGALGKVSASGGEPSELTTLAGKETLHQLPQMLQDGRHVVFNVVSPNRYELAVASLNGGAYTLLGIEGSGASFVAPNHLVFARGETMFAIEFDPLSNRPTGTPSQVLDDAAVFATTPQVLLPLLSADAAGSVAYLNRGGTSSQLQWMTAGTPPLPLPDADYRALTLSPDGRRAVVTVGGTPPDAWAIDLERNTRLRLTFTGASSPIWSPDGSRIAYWSGADGLMTVAADGSGKPEPFGDRVKGVMLLPSSWARDGTSIVVTAEDRGAGRGVRNRDLLVVRAGQKPVPLLATPADERAASISPDGHWFAYASSVSGREEIYVRPFEGGGATIPVSSEGGTFPRWPRQDAIYFLGAKGIMRAPITMNPLRIGTPALATSVPPSLRGADTAADGRVLIIQQKNEAATRDTLHVLLNWGRSLR